MKTPMLPKLLPVAICYSLFPIPTPHAVPSYPVRELGPIVNETPQNICSCLAYTQIAVGEVCLNDLHPLFPDSIQSYKRCLRDKRILCFKCQAFQSTGSRHPLLSQDLK